MSNMSYCRFGNTLRDLEDCADALDQGEVEDMSESEKGARKDLIALCVRIAKDYGEQAGGRRQDRASKGGRT